MPFSAQEADQLHGEAKYDEVFEYLKSASEENSTDVEIAWRLARAYFDLQEPWTDKKKKERHIREGLKAAEQALKLNEDHFAPHKWFAILLSELGNYTGTKEKIGNSFKIKSHFLKAHELNDKDSTTLYCLGRWCFAVSSIGWMQRKIASALFDSPPESSYEEAKEYFLKAYELEPSYKRNCFALGETYYALSDKAKTQEWMRKCLEIKPVGEVEKKLDEDAKKYL